MREVDGEGLRAALGDPFVRHQTDPAAVVRAFVDGAAAVVQTRSHLPRVDGHLLLALGPAADLARLLPRVAEVVEAPARISVEAGALDAVPALWRPELHKVWHWMLTRSWPPAPRVPVEEVPDAAEVDALLDAFAPDAHARPGTPGVECWLGVRSAGTLVAVGALARQHDGTGHLRAVTVAPAVRGRGLGRELSAALTRRALAGRSGVATLGVYADNEPALAVYRRLDYELLHTFVAGPVRSSSITTAVAPSR